MTRARTMMLVVLASASTECTIQDRTDRPAGDVPTLSEEPLLIVGVLGTEDGAEGRLVPGGVEAEVARALGRIDALLAAAALDGSDLVACTAFLASSSDAGTVAEAFSDRFPDAPPVRPAVVVGVLPLGARVELECVASSGPDVSPGGALRPTG